MKTQLRIIGFIILAFSFGCNQNEEDLSFDNYNIFQEYESFNVEQYKTVIERQIIAASEIHKEILNKVKKQSYSSSTTPQSKKIKIDVPGDYSTVQEAVNAAPEGAEIKIKGNFTEIVYIVGKNNLTLKGIDDASIENVEFTLVLFSSNNIQIKNLIVRGHIFVGSSQSIEIKNNDISGSSRGYGVFLDNNIHCTIKDNYIHDLTGDNLNSGGGIYGVFNNDDNEIKGNIITRARVGIELLNGSENNIIKDNIVSDTRWTGISLVENSIRNKVYNNSIVDAAWGGLTIFRSNENDIRGVQITGSNGTPPSWFAPFAVGIGIAESSNNSINDITTNNNTVGVGLRFNATNNIISNLRTNNNSLVGLILEPTADSNTIRESSGMNNGLCDLLDEGNDNSFIESEFNNICN